MELPATRASICSYEEWRHKCHRLLQQKAEAATLGNVRSGSAVGRLPLGYEYGHDGKAQADPSRERLLREAFLLAAEGRRSVRQILAEVTERGLRGRGGKQLDASQLWRVLANPFYAGLVTYRGEALPGRHPPLVSAETFGRSQQSLGGRSKRRRKSPKA